MNRGQNWGIARLKAVWHSVFFAGTVWAALSGVALATNGLKSAPQPDRSWESYYGVAILPSGRAVVVGDKGVVMTSDDGGRTWTRQLLKKGYYHYNLYSVAFTPDASRGWVVGDGGVIFRTDDGGLTWTEQQSPAGSNGALLQLAVSDAQKFCAAGDRGILCTSDGGTNWNFEKFHDMSFFDVAFSDPSNVWAVGEFGTLLHSADGGKNWQVQSGGELGKGDPLFSVAFEGPQGLAVGLIGSSLQTSDGGKTWQPRELSIGRRSLYTVATVPSSAGEFYAAGEQGLATSIENGQATLVPSGVAEAISSLAFSPRFALAVGLSGTLLRSDDGGRHWRSLLNNQPALLTEAEGINQ